MKLRLVVLLSGGLCLATAAIGQLQSVATSAQSSSLKSTCPPPSVGQTAWFDPCVYLLRGNGLKLPRAISTPDPEYSEYARQNQIKGSLLLAVAVNAGGTVDAVKVVQSLEPSLDQNAVEAIKKWRFLPATKNGMTVPVQMEVTVGFNLY